MARKKIKTVYIVGPLTPKGYNSVHPAIDYLLNVRNMARVALEVFKAGYDPFCPALDFLYFLLLREGEFITEAMIKRYSKTWMDASDCLLLTKGWQQSGGSLAEIKRAESQGQPIFKSVKEIDEYNWKIEEEEKGLKMGEEPAKERKEEKA